MSATEPASSPHAEDSGPLTGDGADSVRRGGPVALLTVVCVLLTVIPFLAEAHWMAELFSHFRVQYVFASGFVLLVSVVLRRLKCAAVVAGCVALNAWSVLPYLSAAASADPAGDSISILSANVRDTNRNPGRLLDLVRSERPDVLLVIEHTPEFDDALVALHDEYPYRLTAPAEGPFGIALYSRLPAHAAHVFRLGASDAVRASIDGQRGPFELFGLHLMPPTGAERARARNEQIEQLGQRLAAARPARAVVCGDFNLSPYSPYYHRLLAISGLGDPRIDRGLARTWPVAYPPLGLPIDHCLTRGNLRVVDLRTLGDIGSDHYPLLIEIVPGTPR